MSPQPDESAQRRRLLFGVMLAVAVWGVVLSLGAFLFGIQPETNKIVFAPNFIRGAIPAICVLVFVGGWAFLVWRQPKT